MINVHHFNDPINDQVGGNASEMISLIDQKNKPDLFLININYSYANIRRTDNAGIMLLKQLRLCGYREHCVIYSFLSREQLMVMDWRNMIIFSEGVTFVRMPFDLESLDKIELAKKKAPEDLSAFFKPEFQLPNRRHFFANWWGVLRLWQVHKLLLKGNDTISMESAILVHARTEMMSYQGLMAQYIFGINKDEIEKSLAAISMRMKHDRLNDLENERVGVTRSLEEIETARTQKQDTTGASGYAVSSNWLAALKTSFLAYVGRCKKERMIDDAWQKLEAEKQVFVHRQQQLDEQIRLLKDELNDITNTLPDEECPASSNELSQVLNTLRGNVASNNPTILYIDDQANEGWQQIFAQILFDGENEKFLVYQPTKENTDKILSRTFELVREKRPDLIMLDLRLSPEDEHSKDVADVSGIKVLHNIRKEFANTLCPVLVVSASNKLWSYKTVLASGADAYWMKEGMDVHQDAYGSSNNYSRLLSILDALLFSEHYKQLKEIRKIYEQISVENTPYWWESKNWVHKQSTYSNVEPTGKESVLGTLSEAIQMMKNKLAKELFIENRIAKNVDYQVAVVGRLFKIIEEIHRTNNAKFDKEPLINKISIQLYNTNGGNLPQTIVSLNKTRNKAVHRQHLEANEFTVFVNNLSCYLSEHPNPPDVIRTKGEFDSPGEKRIWNECISKVNYKKPNEILLTRPHKMDAGINCPISIPSSFFTKKQYAEIKKGWNIQYKLTLQNIEGGWEASFEEVEVLKNNA
jgi:CheY-like chemotaxis protein